MKKTITLFAALLISTAGLWAQATPNAGFETWTHVTGFFAYDTPNNWDCANSQSATVGIFGCVKATKVHSGSFAVELITESILSITAPGVVTTGTLPTSTSGPITGGIAYSGRPDSISGWYEYTPQGADKAFFSFYLFGSAANNADTVAEASFSTPNATVSTYKYFNAPLVYRNSDPVVNSIWLISSSAGTGTAVVGSTLYADDLGIITNPAGINELASSEVSISVYPNPATDYVTVSNPSSVKATLTLSDVTGRVISSAKIDNGSTTTINVSTLPGGVYIYSIVDANNTSVKTGKLIIQK
jgi:hypothetical protein